MNEDTHTQAEPSETQNNPPQEAQGRDLMEIAPGRIENLPALPGGGWLPAPTTFEQAMHWAEMIAASRCVPKEYQGSPGDVLIAVQMGSDVGLSWAQALQNIAVINGRPSMWGDAVLAVVRASGLLEDIQEWISEDATEARCRVKRKGSERAIERSFTLADAQQAKLPDKGGPWKQYPTRMLQMRARSWALRDEFPDVLKGIAIREEEIDAIEGNVSGSPTASSVVQRLQARAKGAARDDDPAAGEPVTASVVETAIGLITKRADVPEVAAMLNRLEDKEDRLRLGRVLSAHTKKTFGDGGRE